MKPKGYEKALKQVRSLCLALPETREVTAWGHPTFRAGKKMFAGFGQDDQGLTLGLKVGFDRQDELLRDERFFPTPYAARQGWVSLRVGAKTDWEEVRGLVREAYCQVAISRMLKALNGSYSPAFRRLRPEPPKGGTTNKNRLALPPWR
jgi:predicted DNA-binding protein (MmcQ/YjbR family)